MFYIILPIVLTRIALEFVTGLIVWAVGLSVVFGLPIVLFAKTYQVKNNIILYKFSSLEKYNIMKQKYDKFNETTEDLISQIERGENWRHHFCDNQCMQEQLDTTIVLLNTQLKDAYTEHILEIKKDEFNLTDTVYPNLGDPWSTLWKKLFLVADYDYIYKLYALFEDEIKRTQDKLDALVPEQTFYDIIISPVIFHFKKYGYNFDLFLDTIGVSEQYCGLFIVISACFIILAIIFIIKIIRFIIKKVVNIVGRYYNKKK